ncbi:serine hydrolase domain-containing protein [Sphingobacterium bovistauri]|uniref:Beta-lactamase family protein n=1 Tax=Sphingobacterium bovistauri TaxID=2781959 RepID=A0ABS7Z5R6_9SPHI|nr:serine hydrolase domain-containing protein [Sphingobacterium bovistauri]MCA5004887.1 beta-lactamase family protein [Sphingobacterium bovistauri]
MRKYYCTILVFIIATMTFAQQSDNILRSYYLNKKEPGGILVIKNKSDINTFYAGAAHVEKNLKISELTRFRMASLSKQFTAMAVYLLIQDGKISFDTPVRTIFPELPVICDSIEINHLINHSSGLVDYENVIPKSQVSQLTDANVFDLVKNIDTVYFEAGTKFRYSNTAYFLLSLLVERISKQSYESFCKERIFDKLGMQSAQISAPDTFINRAFGYKINAKNFRFGDQSVTSATRGDGGVYISANDFQKWMDKANPLFTSIFFKDLEKHSIVVKDKVYYGLGLFFTKSGEGRLTLFHSGESTGFHNIFLYQPHDDLGISLFTNRDDLKIANMISDVMKSENLSLPPINESLFLWLNKVYSAGN